MTDDKTQEATRLDAPSTEDSLFGEAASYAPAVDVEEHDAGKEAEQDLQDPDEAGDGSAPSDELKVVVSMKGDRATIGVQQPSSDPYIESFDDLDLSGLAQEFPSVVERARARWEEAPKHPAYVKPAPPAKRRNQRGRQQEAQASTAEGEAEQEEPEAPRLF